MQETSRMAYESQLEKGHIEALKPRIVRAVFELGGHATKGEIARHLGLSQEQVHKRINECVKAQCLAESDTKRRDPDTHEFQMAWIWLAHFPAEENIKRGS